MMADEKFVRGAQITANASGSRHMADVTLGAVASLA
jgi:hypothetical protein